MENTNPLLLFGPLYLGSNFNWGLCGALVVQLHDYILTYHSKDRALIKSMVYSVFTIELFQTTTLTMLMWDVFVAGYGNVTPFDKTGWSSWVAPALSGIVSTTVQVFFAWRIWGLKKTPIAAAIAIFICLIAFMQGSAGVAITVLYAFDPLPAHLYRLNTVVQVWLIGSCICDILIAVTMVTLLMQARKSSPFRNTETLINRLIANSVESGSITAVLAILELVFYSAFPDNFLHVMMMYVRGRVYANVLLAALNGRKRAVRTKPNESTLGAVTAQLHFAGSQTLYQANMDEEEAMAMSPKRCPAGQGSVQSVSLPVDGEGGHNKRPTDDSEHTPTHSIVMH